MLNGGGQGFSRTHRAAGATTLSPSPSTGAPLFSPSGMLLLACGFRRGRFLFAGRAARVSAWLPCSTRRSVEMAEPWPSGWADAPLLPQLKVQRSREGAELCRRF